MRTVRTARVEAAQRREVFRRCARSCTQSETAVEVLVGDVVEAANPALEAADVPVDVLEWPVRWRPPLSFTYIKCGSTRVADP